MPAAGPFVTAATMSLNYKADRLAGELHQTESRSWIFQASKTFEKGK